MLYRAEEQGEIGQQLEGDVQSKEGLYLFKVVDVIWRVYMLMGAIQRRMKN